MELSNILLKIKNNKQFKQKILEFNSGIDFEKNILYFLKENKTYVCIETPSFKKHANFKQIKELLKSEGIESNYIKTNLLKDIKRPSIVYQPLGRQNSPDFLLIRKDKIFALECKSTQKNSEPVWNSGLPNTCYNYIFSSLGKKDVTFFPGNKIILTKERKKILYLVEKERKTLKTEGLKITKNFGIYLRPMYNQKFKILSHEKREDFENSVIKETINFEKQ